MFEVFESFTSSFLYFTFYVLHQISDIHEGHVAYCYETLILTFYIVDFTHQVVNYRYITAPLLLYFILFCFIFLLTAVHVKLTL